MKSASNTSELKSTPKSTLHPLERRVLTRLLKAGLKGERWVVAISGGLDSVVLAHVLGKISKFGRWELTLAHIHHGDVENLEQQEFRNASRASVFEFGRVRNIPVIVRISKVELKSEADARKFRHGALKAILTEVGAQRVVMAHHRDDLLETRLIRLIRGTGPQGLKSMELKAGVLLRPFLKESRAELRSYARAEKLTWGEDPSNQQTHFLRNWVRKTWMPALETFREGSTLRVSESLELIVRQLEIQGQSSGQGPEAKVLLDLKEDRTARWSRRAFLDLNELEKGELLSLVFRKLQAPRMSQGRIGEVRKRIDSTRHHLGFHVGGLEFDLNQDQVVCRRI